MSRQPQMQHPLDLDMPANLDAERFVLGAAMSDDDTCAQTIELLAADDFSIEKHKRIFLRMGELHERGERVDHVTLANELQRQGQLPSVDGLSYLVSLDDGMPPLYNLDSYIRIIQHKATLRKAITAAADLIERCQAGSEDSDEIAEVAERLVTQLSEQNAGGDMPQTVGQIVEAEGGINRFLQPETVLSIPLPFRVLNATLDGLRKNKLVLIAARPGSGKTALMQQCAEHAAEQGFRTLVISKEMKGRDIIHRSLCGRADVSAYSFRKGRLTPEQRQRIVGDLQKLITLDDLLLIYDNQECTVQKIAFLLRRLRAANKPVHAVFIDYVQILDSVGRYENRVQELARISKSLVKLKKEFDIPIVVLSQLNRDGDASNSKDDEPKSKHIAEADQLVRDADALLLLWIAQKEEEEEIKNPKRTELIVNWKVTKNRDGMKNRGGVDSRGENRNGLVFMKQRVRFVEDNDGPAPNWEAA